MSSYTNRQTVTKYERYFWRIACLLMIGNLLIGLGFVFGAPTASSSYDAAKAILPVHTWGMFAISTALIFFGGLMAHNRWLILIALSMGGFYTTLFGITFVFAYIGGYLLGFTGIVWWLIIGAIHTMAAIALPPTTQIKRLKHERTDTVC